MAGRSVSRQESGEMTLITEFVHSRQMLAPIGQQPVQSKVRQDELGHEKEYPAGP